jgi:hypothetical protein
VNISVLNVVMFTTGALLIYSGIKDVNPAQVVKDALAGNTSGLGKGDPPNVAVPGPDGSFAPGGAGTSPPATWSPAIPNPDGTFGR